MYTYNLSVAMSDKNFSFTEYPEMIQAIKDAIEISNSSFSATRYKRTIEYIDLIDEKHIFLKMHSRDAINPTRSLSSLSRALVNNERMKQSDLLEGRLINGCVFNAQVINSHTPTIINDLSDSEVIQVLVEMATGTKYSSISTDTLNSVKQVVINALNAYNKISQT